MQLNSLSTNSIKDTIINRIVQDIAIKEDLNSAQIAIRKKDLETKIKSKQLITDISPQSGIISSKNINDVMESLYIDLLTTFESINNLDNSIDNHLELNEAAINGFKSQINKANDKIDKFEIMIGTKSNPNYHIEGFRTTDDFESNMDLYTERYGERIPASCKVNFNSNEEVITLPKLISTNMIVYKNGVSVGDASINKQLGLGLLNLGNDKNILENIIDTSMQSYWSSSILCDSPMNITNTKVKPTVIDESTNFYYGINHGAMCELVLTFEAISTINEVSLSPYGPYPVDIISIRYKTSDDIDEPLQELICPDNKIPDRKGKSISTTSSFRFPDVSCKKVFILFNQIHYIKNTLVYNANDVFKNELWFSVTGTNSVRPLILKDSLFKPMYADRAIDSASWTYINNLAVKNKNIDLKDVLLNNSNINKTVVKYQYTYGFYNISPNFNDFDRTGVYVSRPIYANGNIQSIVISTDESHPLTSDHKQVTDIEYYICYNDNPTYEDWKPILPSNIDEVECELLQVEGSLCYLRFPAKEVYSVAINGVNMNDEADYILHYTESNDAELNGTIYAIDIPNLDFFAKYTVNYKPVDSARKLSLINFSEGTSTTSSVETLYASNSSYYKLRNYPYISSTIVSTKDYSNTHVKLSNKNTGETFTQDNKEIECVTNVYTSEESYMSFNPFDPLKSNYQYYIDKDYIYFNKNIPDYYQIEVNYNHYVSSIRLKAIMRRNNLKLGWMTPILDKIKYEFITVD